MRNPRPYLGSFPCPTCLQSGDAVGAPWYSFQVSLMATVNSRYVVAENGGAAPLIANRTAIGPWEQFDLATI